MSPSQPAAARRAPSAPAAPSLDRSGLLQGLGAYGLWGLFPLYFLSVSAAAPTEIVAHRISWSLLFLVVLLTATRGWREVRTVAATPRALGTLALASVFISVNWVVYALAVLTGHAVEAALGYFINPLVSAGLGVVLLRERLSRLQWTALGFGLAAVLVLAFAYGSVPWIALALACSFGLYGFVKNRVGRSVGASASLTVETALLVLPAVAYLVWLGLRGEGTFVSAGPLHAWLLVASGAVTAVPLLLFGSAARRLPLSTVGTLQFITPTLQFVLALTVFGEPMPPERLAGFVLVWVAVLLLALDMWRRQRSNPSAARA